jgi:hypothetical protein
VDRAKLRRAHVVRVPHTENPVRSVTIMVEAIGLKLWHRGHLQWHDVPNELHENQPVGSEVNGTDTDWWSHKPPFISKRKWLKIVRPHGLKRRSTAAWLLRSRVRIPLGAWMFVSCIYMLYCPVVLCDGLITRPKESYRVSNSVWLRDF